MRRYLAFWWLCARTAFWGNSTFANDWQWVFGNPVTSTFGGVVVAAVGALAPTIATRFGATEMTTGTPALDSFLGALAAFIVTWFVAFVVRVSYVPVQLFDEQKGRADKLDPTVITVQKVSSNKVLAALQKRYLFEKRPLKREVLDYEIDGGRAIADVTLIFHGLTESAVRLTKALNRHKKKMARISNPEKKRAAISKLALAVNLFSDETDEFAAVFRALTPEMFECISQFVEKSPQGPPESYAAFLKTIRTNVQGAIDGVSIIAETQNTFAIVLTGVSADLNAASARSQLAIAGLVAEATNYKNACEIIEDIVLKRSGLGQEELNENYSAKPP